MNIQISADSTCDLPRDVLVKEGITLAPLAVLVDDEIRHDRVDITPEQVFAAVEGGRQVHSGAVNQAEYEALFRRLLEKGDAVIHICIGSHFSACYQNACAAARRVGNVYVVDSRNLFSGSGFQVLDACRMAREGYAAEEIVRALEDGRDRIACTFIVSGVDYLYRGGRVTGLEAVGVKVLQIRPSIELKNGEMKPGKKYRGNFARCALHYVADQLTDPETIDDSLVFLGGAGLDADLIAQMKQLVLEKLPRATLMEVTAGCVISTHCGPGTASVVLRRRAEART